MRFFREFRTKYFSNEAVGRRTLSNAALFSILAARVHPRFFSPFAPRGLVNFSPALPSFPQPRAGAMHWTRAALRAVVLVILSAGASVGAHAQISGPGANFNNSAINSGGGFGSAPMGAPAGGAFGGTPTFGSAPGAAGVGINGSPPQAGFSGPAAQGIQFGAPKSHPTPTPGVVMQPPVRYKESDASQSRLSDAVSWLAPQLAAFDGMRSRVLAMDQVPYLRFVQGQAQVADDQTPIGHWALEALFLSNGETNGEKTPLCFLLYNPQQIRTLDDAFFAPARKMGQEQAAITFVVAHESGHCVDFEQGTSVAPANWRPEARNRWLEYGADLFAGLTILQAGTPPSLLESIIRLRDLSGDEAHETAPALRELLAEWNAGAIRKSMDPRERWAHALRIRALVFRP